MSAAGRFWLNASQDPRQPGGGEGRPAAGSPDTHRPYHNDFLDDTFCVEDGEYWPCLAHRQQTECLCGHQQSTHGKGGVGQCWSVACGCSRMRPRVNA